MVFAVFDDAIQDVVAKLPMIIFAAAEIERAFDPMSLFQKIDGVTHLRAIVMIGHIGVKLYFFDSGLALFCILFFFALFIFEFAVIHDPANRWIGSRRDFDQIQLPFAGSVQGFSSAHDTDLCPVEVDKPDFGYADFVIDASKIAVGSGSTIWADTRPPASVLLVGGGERHG